MVFLHIDKKNCINGRCNLVEKLDKYMGKNTNKIFLLIFMEGCGPCNATRPEWTKLKNVLSPEFLNRDDIIISSIDHTLAEKLKNLKTKPSSFPTMRFIEGSNVENYEDSSIDTKDRTIDSFIEWIKLKSGVNLITKSESNQRIIKNNFKKSKKNNFKKSKQNKTKQNKTKQNKKNFKK
jgi:glycerophosphoryl diester phosphodiesterase